MKAFLHRYVSTYAKKVLSVPVTPRHVYKLTRSFSLRQYSSTTNAPNWFTDDKKRILKLNWNKTETSFFPYSWLRDSCQCHECFHPVSTSRQILMRDFDPNCQPNQFTVNMDSKTFNIVWNDGHPSIYGFDFLKLRNFTPEAQARHDKDVFLEDKIHWAKENMERKILKFDYQKIISQNDELYNLLNSLSLYGLCLIQNSPSDNPLVIKQLQEVISNPDPSNYGITFEVKSKPDPSNLAYTPRSLGFHTDLSFYTSPPDIQCLHCVVQNEGIIGGENQFVDGFYAAEELKRNDSEAYQTLSTQNIDYRDYGTDFVGDFHFVKRKPMFQHDENGQLYRINVNNPLRDTYLNMAIDDVDRFYRAMKKFEDVMTSNSIEHKLQTGEIAIFDNIRILHARKSFQVAEAGERHLVGWYYRWDDVHSCIRRLKEKLGK